MYRSTVARLYVCDSPYGVGRGAGGKGSLSFVINYLTGTGTVIWGARKSCTASSARCPVGYGERAKKIAQRDFEDCRERGERTRKRGHNARLRYAVPRVWVAWCRV